MPHFHLWSYLAGFGSAVVLSVAAFLVLLVRTGVNVQ